VAGVIEKIDGGGIESVASGRRRETAALKSYRKRGVLRQRRNEVKAISARQKEENQ
jgi:hypothetical protein